MGAFACWLALLASGQGVSCNSSEPENGRGDGEFGVVVGGSFGVAGGQIAELFEPRKQHSMV
jgi:hypothetical protein